MPPKQNKKTTWVNCELCGCTMTSNEINVHVDWNCAKDSHQLPYFNNGIFYSTLQRSAALPDGVPRGVLLLHTSVGSLLNACLGAPIEMRNSNGLSLVRKMWPSRTAALGSIILPVDDIPSEWSNNADKIISVSLLRSDILEAMTVSIKFSKNNVSPDLCDILKEYFCNYYIKISSVLTYLYFGKMLEITMTDIQPKSNDGTCWYMITNDTKFIIEKDVESSNIKEKSLGGVSDLIEEMKTLIDAAFNNSNDSFQCTKGMLIYGHSGVGKTAICRYLIKSLACHHVEINGSAIFSKYFGETEKTMESLFNEAFQNELSIIFVDEIETICPKKSSSSTEQERRVTSAFIALVDMIHERKNKVFILATTRKPDLVDSMLRRFGRLDKEMEVPVPDQLRRRDMLACLLHDVSTTICKEDIYAIADLAHGYVAADLVNLCAQGSMNCMKRQCSTIDRDDLMSALTVVRPSAMRELLVEVPNVRWTDIGGQEDLKLKLKQAVEWPLKHADSFTRLGIKPPGGVLMYGPPGCSKTMIAKALATESGLNFLSIKGPELFSKWVGESERAVRDLFRKARQVAPAIIFFDEMDAIGGQRTADVGVHERVLAQLLTEMDGVVPLGAVTILAATNRPDRIDSALLRPGRLDRLIYVSLPDMKTRIKILELKLGKMAVTTDITAAYLAERTDGFSGAELHAVCHEAALKALQDDLSCTEVTKWHFDSVLANFIPRTPKSLLRIYEQFNHSGTGT